MLYFLIFIQTSKSIDMKKKSLKSLELNKKAISKLNSHEIHGGIIWSIQCRLIKLAADVIISIANDLEGNCVQSWGDPGCPTGIDGAC